MPHLSRAGDKLVLTHATNNAGSRRQRTAGQMHELDWAWDSKKCRFSTELTIYLIRTLNFQSIGQTHYTKRPTCGTMSSTGKQKEKETFMTVITCPHCGKPFDAGIVEWMDTHLAAAEIGLEPQSITYACKHGYIDGAQKHGNMWKFTRAEWDAYLERRSWIGAANAAHSSGIPKKEIDAAASTGRIENARLYGRKWKFSREAWKAYLAKRKPPLD